MDENLIIWRYISLDKFIDLLLNKNIVFTPLSSMSDQNEVRWILDTIDNENEHHRAGVEKFVDLHLKNNFISSWTKNPNEKISLWRHYLGKDGIGVAIKSKIGNLYKYIDWDESSFSIQEVIYKKQIKFNDIETGRLLHTKSIAYEDEEELRVFSNFVMMTFDDNLKKPVFHNPPEIISKKVDLKNFIDGIMISPFCQNWQVEMIKQLILKLEPDLISVIQKSIIREKN